MKPLHKELNYTQTVKGAIAEAEMVGGRTIPEEQKNGIISYLCEDLKGKFAWVTSEYLRESFNRGLSSDFKYLDLKTIYKWLWDYKNAPEMKVKIAMESPLVSIDVPEWESINWQMEVNKCFSRFKRGQKDCRFWNAATYGRLLLDGFIKLHAYREFYTGEDVFLIYEAQRKTVAKFFAQNDNFNFIYDPNQFIKTANERA